MFNVNIIFFILWKLLDVFTSVIAPKFIPYLGFFSYGDTMLKYGLPSFIRGLTNFDGIFYIRISLQGYSQYEQAYFPLYPLLIRFFTLLTFGNPIIAGVLISNIVFIFGLIVFLKYAAKITKNQNLIWLILFLLCYPTSFFFGVMYTESLFFLLLLSSVYFFQKEKYILSFLFAFLTGLTRVTGVFLVILLIFEAYKKIRVKNLPLWKNILNSKKMLVVLTAPILGISTYCFYLWFRYGDPLYFFHAQEYFGAHRSTSLISPPQVIFRYLKIFITANKNFQYYVAVNELFFFFFVSLLLLIDLKNILRKKPFNLSRLGLNVFSFTNVLVPTLTGTLTAIPRYSLLSLSIFFALAEIENKLIKVILLIIFLILHIVFLGLFIQGYYVT